MGTAESSPWEAELDLWHADKHELKIDQKLMDWQHGLVANMKCTKLMLVREMRLVLKTEYLHYAITDGSWFIEFGDGRPSPQQLRVYHIAHVDRWKATEQEFDFTDEVKHRINQVCGATNYSVLLRNSEHLARYIQSGTWCSLQVTGVSPIFQAACAVGQMGAETKALVNTPPRELQNRADSMTCPIVYQDWKHPSYSLSFEEQRQVPFELEKTAHNIVLLGPTGAGKSTLINAIFNRKVAEARETCHSVTRNMAVYTGTVTNLAEGSEQKVNVLDTIGFCDSVLSSSDVISLVKEFVKNQSALLDKVIVVTSGTIQKPHIKAIQNFMEWLQQKHHTTEFLFVYNKTEHSGDRRLALVGEMCDSLGVDPRQAIPVPGSHPQRVINCAFATGFPPGAPLKDVSEDLEKLITAALQKTNESSRIKVDMGKHCAIL